MFHQNVSEILYLCQQTCTEIQTAVAFLTTREKKQMRMISRSCVE